MTIADRWGNGIGTSSAEAAELLEQATTELVLFRDDPGATMDAAIDADPDATLPRIVRAEFDLFAQTRATQRAARDRLAEVDAMLGTAPPREQLHAAAADAWANGQLEAAISHLDRAIVLDPHDLLAIRVAHDLSFFAGDPRNIRDVVARAWGAWAESDPLFGVVQGMYAFGLEENADYRRAEGAARSALSSDGADVWATHALAHVFEMEGRTDEGVSFLTTSSTNWEGSFFAVHNWWHLALYLIERGELEQALALYDGPVRKSGSSLWLDLVDAASLLWRLSLHGVDVGERAGALVDLFESKLEDALSAFNDLHSIMALSLAGREDLVGEVLAAGGRDHDTTNTRALAASGRDLLLGFAAFGRDDAPGAVEHLLRARSRSAAIGGSVAQRDVIDQTLIAAAVRAGDDGLVRALVSERVEHKSSAANSVGRLVEANTR
jgi:tetratricopeptide (TPR) repeat protein